MLTRNCLVVGWYFKRCLGHKLVRKFALNKRCCGSLCACPTCQKSWTANVLFQNQFFTSYSLSKSGFKLSFLTTKIPVVLFLKHCKRHSELLHRFNSVVLLNVGSQSSHESSVFSLENKSISDAFLCREVAKVVSSSWLKLTYL